MRIISTLLLLGAMLISFSTSANAQDNKTEWYPNWFVGVQAGGQAIVTGQPLSDYITPHFAVQVGRWLSPEVGVRLHVMGYKTKGYVDNSRYNLAHQSFKYNSCAASFDFLFNMSNIIFPNRQSQRLNWIMLTGIGGFYAWDYEEPVNNSITARDPNYQFRLGTQFEYALSKHFGVNLELQGNYKSNRYGLKCGSEGDVQLAAFVGLSYKFGNNKKAQVVEPEPQVPVTTQSSYDAEAAARAEAEAAAAAARLAAQKAAEAKAAAAKAVAAKVEPLEETVFYTIGKTDPKNDPVIDKVVEWCNKYNDKNITVSGYADKGTGTARVNQRVSSQRATRVADAIKAKGIAADRISVNAYGDTVQPFAENNQNRCTIIVGK